MKRVNTDSYLLIDSKNFFLYYVLGTFLDAGDTVLNQRAPVEVRTLRVLFSLKTMNVACKRSSVIT